MQGLGQVGGFKLYVEDRAGLGFEELYRQVQNAAAAGQKEPALAGLFSSFQVSVPQIDVHVDRERVKTYGIPLTDVFDTLQVYLGSLYANDFNRFGRTYQVNVQAESSFRMQPEQIARLKTRNARGEMVPLGSVLRVSRTYGPDQVMHYNGYPAAEINGAPSPGHSSGQAQAAIAGLLERTLPNGMTFEWTELAYQDAISGNTMLLIFPLCVLLVYGVLAAQYESWSLPLSVILIVPMTLLSAIAGVWLTGGDNNVFTQISFLVLAGLACKNAILIVEFARQREHEGAPRRTAILDACRIRLRPVLMTSVAFIMGVVPLVLASGPGAEVRQAMGIAVFAGMLGVTLFGLFLTPVFYVVVQGVAERLSRRRSNAAGAGRGRCRGGSLIVRKIANRLSGPGTKGLLVALVAVQAAACAARITPQASVQASTLTRWDAAAFSGDSFDPRWWRQLEDPVLDELENAALSANHDIRSALARLDQSRAIFDEERRRRYPTATANAFVDVREQGQPGFSDQPARVTTYRVGLDASWELDFFGRVRSAIAAASANADSFEAALESVRVSVAADVARNYFELRGIQQQLAVLDRSLANQRETLRLTVVRRDAGFGEEQDVASASARVAAIEAAVPPLRTALAVREHRLGVLTGRIPGQLAETVAPRAYPVLAKSIALGPPDQLLTRRPDVRVAERRLAVAAASAGVAAADLYPRITISGVLGLLAGRGSMLGSSDSRLWAVTPALQWSAFDIGSARARLRGAHAATAEALAEYEKTMLLALEETETALVMYRQRQERLVSLTDEVRESTRAAGIARARYREGVTDFLSLLDAERTALQAEDSAAAAEAEVFTALVGLYRAVGGLK